MRAKRTSTAATPARPPRAAPPTGAARVDEARPDASEPSDVRLRADARANHKRLLAAAARHFATHGTDASMKAIARDAEVGVGTLYRRFPTRAHLVEAVYRSESQRLAAAADELLAAGPPLDAVQAWMARFLEYMATKRGMADALKTLLTSDAALRTSTRRLLIDALASLLRAGEEAGVLRPGLDATDVVLALGGFAMIVGEEPHPALSTRLVALLIAGLRARD